MTDFVETLDLLKDKLTEAEYASLYDKYMDLKRWYKIHYLCVKTKPDENNRKYNYFMENEEVVVKLDNREVNIIRRDIETKGFCKYGVYNVVTQHSLNALAVVTNAYEYDDACLSWCLHQIDPEDPTTTFVVKLEAIWITTQWNIRQFFGWIDEWLHSLWTFANRKTLK